MRKSLIVVLILSLLFAFLFAVGGAGIYGSPFIPVPAHWPSRREHDVERLLMALTILVGPLACGAALAVHKRSLSPRFACVPLALGAVAGALLGTETKFVYVWEKVFLITVWLPMIVVAIWIANEPRRS
jgi:hypothetical protein